MEKEIIKKLEELNNTPSNIELLKEIAFIYFNQQKYQHAIMYMTAALEFDQDEPNKEKEYRILYQSHNKIGNYRKAKKYFETARAYNPMHEEVLSDLFEFYNNDWSVYLEEGFNLGRLAVEAGVTYATANNKKVVIFVYESGQESKSYMVHNGTSIKSIDDAKTKKITMVCPQSRILPIKK